MLFESELSSMANDLRQQAISGLPADYVHNMVRSAYSSLRPKLQGRWNDAAFNLSMTMPNSGVADSKLPAQMAGEMAGEAFNVNTRAWEENEKFRMGKASDYMQYLQWRDQMAMQERQLDAAEKGPDPFDVLFRGASIASAFLG